MARAHPDNPAPTEAIHVDFDSFLKAAIYQFYRTSGAQRKGDFIALLIASGETLSLAIEAVRRQGSPRNVALGAASVLALRVGLRYALSGPLGLVLAAGAAASLILYFVGHRGQILGRIDAYRTLVDSVRTDYTTIGADLRDGRIDQGQHALMVDGLLRRFLQDLDAS